MKSSPYTGRVMLAALGVLLVLLVLLLFAIDEVLPQPFDARIATELREQTNPVFAAVMTYVSVLGKVVVAVPLTIAASIGLFLIHRPLEAVFALGTGSNLVVSSTLKVIVGRVRPMYDLTDARGFIQVFEGYSFPSGHVVFFMSFFGTLAYMAWRHIAGRVRWVIVIICALLIVLVGPSRVYLGAHWATDVAGGYIVGAIWLLVLIFTYETVLERFASVERETEKPEERG